MKPALSQLYVALMRGYRRQWLRFACLQGMLALALYAGLAGMIGQGSLHAPLNTAWLWALTLLQTILFLAALWRVWQWRTHRLEDLAAEWDHAHSEMADPFRIALNAFKHPDAFSDQDKLALENLYQPQLQNLHPPRPKGWLLWQRYAVSLGALAYALSCGVSSAPQEFVIRTLLPGWKALQLPRLQFDWTRTDLRVAQGDSLEIWVGVSHAQPEQKILGLVVAQSGGQAQRFELTVQNSQVQWKIGPFSADQKLQLQGANGTSKWQTLRVLNAPIADSLHVTVIPPEYTGLPRQTWPEGQLSGAVLQGSLVRWNVHAPSLSKWIWTQEISDTLLTDTLVGSHSISRSQTLVQSVNYGFRLCDDLDICSVPLASQMLPHHIEAKADQPPEIQILSPLDQTTLDRQPPLAFLLRVLDDVKVQSLELHWKIKIPGRTYAQGKNDVTAWLNDGQDGTVAGTWDFSKIHLQEQQNLELQFKACDGQPNRDLACSFSESIHLHWPEITQISKQISQQEQTVMDRLQSAADRSQKAERDLQAAQGSSQQEGPPPLQGADIDRIMVQEPSSHHNRVAQALKNDPSLAQSPTAQKMMKENLKAIPTMGQSKLSPDLKQKHLQALMAAQKQMQKGLQEQIASLQSPPPKTKDTSGLRKFREAVQKQESLKQLEEEVARNLEHQQDLAAYFKDEAKQAEAQQQQLDAALEEQRRMVEEVQQATQGVEQAMQQSRQNGLASPELLQKMEKLQAMMKDLLPDSLRALLQKKAEGKEVDLDQIKERLAEVLEHKGEFEQGIDRALSMLEALQDMRRIETLRQQIEALAKEQNALAQKMASKPGKNQQDGTAKQEELKKRFDAATQEFQKEAKARPNLKDAGKKLAQSTAAEDLEKALAALKSKSNAPSSPSESNPNPSPNAPSSSGEGDDGASESKQAAKSLSNLSAGLGDLLKKNSRKPKINLRKLQVHLQQSLELSQLQIQSASESAIRESQGWASEPTVLYGAISRAAFHLENQLKQTLRGLEAGGRLILMEAHSLTELSKRLSEDASRNSLRNTLVANHKLTREILRTLKMLQQSKSGGSGMAGGEGEGSSGQGESSGEGEGEGSGQGSGDGMDAGDVGEALKGISGEQMAVNQATFQLLRSMLDGRAPAPGSSGSEGSGKSDQNGKGQGGKEGGGEAGGNGDGGSNSSNPGMNGSEGKAGSAAGNRQGQIGEAIEQLAEKASEEGGGAGRLRQLAEEARALEKALRNSAMSPDEAQKRQERFQMRLLEATRALEERGKQEKREAETFAGALTGRAPAFSANEEVRRRIEAMREKAKKLPIRAIDKEVLDNFYRELMTR